MILIKKKLHLLLFSLLLFSLSFSEAFSACSDYPDSMIISSGTQEGIEYDISKVNSQSIYIKGDIGAYPVSVSMFFDDIDDDCFSSENDVRMKFLPTGLYVSADSMRVANNQTRLDFYFDSNIELSHSIVSSYLITHKDKNSESTGTIMFDVDNHAPEINFRANPVKSSVLKKGVDVEIDYDISDLKSGLSTLRISGTDIDKTYIGNNRTDGGTILKNLTSSTTFVITARDKLGNVAREEIEYIVDSKKPSFSDFKVYSYAKDTSGRYVSFKIDVKDESFKTSLSNDYDIYGNFSALTSINPIKKGNCESEVGSDVLECVWSRVKIDKINTTTTLPINFKATDAVGNSVDQSYNAEIFYDSEGPDILDFYLVNSKGEKNIFSAYDDNVSVILEFQDDSLDDFSIGEFRIITDFDGGFFANDFSRNYSSGKARYIWDLSDFVSRYSGIDNDNIYFKITIYDSYGNPAHDIINVSINNVYPKIENITIEEHEGSDSSIKDGVIVSGEKINFEVLIRDDNLEDLSENFIYADFSSIDYREGMEKKGATSCGEYNESHIECDFKNIVVGNGYMKRNVTFYVSDVAANAVRKNVPIEVFAIGDEMPQSFKIDPINITNLLNRNLVAATGTTAWFEGIIENIEDDSDLKIVNYQLKSCNDSELNPILIGDRKLYPQNIVDAPGSEEPSRDFALRIDVRTHNNFVDLNPKSMYCSMGIRMRDNTTLFVDEEVRFKVNFEFYDLPRDNLLKANAQDILDDMEDIEALGSWFDTTYNIYKMMDQTCSVMNTVNGIIGSVSEGWTLISWGLRDTVYGTPIAEGGDKAVYTVQGSISSISSGLGTAVNYMCNFVTCQYSYLLLDNWFGGDNPFGKFLKGDYLEFPGACSENISIGDTQ